MYRTHTTFKPPDDQTTIWHYASLPKILGLLSSSSLYFRHIGGFEDQDEGQYTSLDKRIIKHVQGTPYYTKQHEPFGNRYYVNCWTMSEADDLKFWLGYAPGPFGIAIKSSVHRLKTALYLDKKKDIYISPVHYIDRTVDSTFPYYWERINIIEKCFAKGMSYRWENELRLLHLDQYKGEEEPESGILVKVDLASLIDEVYVSPFADIWYARSVESLLRSYEVGNKTVIISNVLR